MTNVGGSRRAAQAREILAVTEPLTAAQLDAAGIPHWRERLADADEADWKETGHRGRQYDLALRLLREEVGRAPLPVAPASAVAPADFPNRQERKYDDDDLRF